MRHNAQDACLCFAVCSLRSSIADEMLHLYHADKHVVDAVIVLTLLLSVMVYYRILPP